MEYTYKKVLNQKTGHWEYKRVPYDPDKSKSGDPVFENVVEKNAPADMNNPFGYAAGSPSKKVEAIMAKKDKKIVIEYKGQKLTFTDPSEIPPFLKKELGMVVEIPVLKTTPVMAQVQMVMKALAPQAKSEFELNPVTLVDDPERGLMELSSSGGLDSIPSLPPEDENAPTILPEEDEDQLFTGRIIDIDES